MRSADNTGRSF